MEEQNANVASSNPETVEVQNQTKQEEVQDASVNIPVSQFKNIIKIYESLGIEVPQKHENLGLEDPKTIEQRINETFQTRLLNSNAEFFDNLRNQFQEKYVKDVMSKAKTDVASRFLLSSDEYEGKDFKDVIELAYAKQHKDKSQTQKDLEERLVEANQKLEKYEKEIIPQIREEVKTERNEFLKERAFLDIISNLDTGNIESQTVLYAVNPVVDKRYEVQYDESSKTLVFVNRSNGRPVLNDMENGFKSSKDIIEGVVKELNLLQLSNANIENQQNNIPNQNQVQQNQSETTQNNSNFYNRPKTQNAPHPAAVRRQQELENAQKARPMRR